MRRWKPDLGRVDVTPISRYWNRREIIAGTAAIGFSSAIPDAVAAESPEPNSFHEITNYNNFVELGMAKDDPAKNAHLLKTKPWTVEIDGLVETPGRYTLEDLVDGNPIDERIYRLRCIETWSLVVPWNGFELRALLDRVGVKSDAR